jgi:hypothetical protein
MAEFTQPTQDVATVTETAVDPWVADVRKEWDWVKKGVDEIVSTANVTYRAEDVYAACVSNQAVLWITNEGFVISTTEIDPFTEEKTMLLWLAWAVERGNDLVSKYQAFFERVAKEAGYGRMETRSPFLGLMSHLIGHGWDVDTVVYTRKL